MAMQLATENGLVTLRVGVRAGPSGIAAGLQLVSYVGGSPRSLAEWSLDSKALALPRRLGARWTPTRRLPGEVTEALAAEIDMLGLAPGVPLWLHLVKPYGFLGAVDWEAALAPVLGRTVLRLPDFLERPRENHSVLNVALVCSEPSAQPSFNSPEVLGEIVTAALQGSPRERTRIHIFADAQYYTSLRARFAADTRIRVHDPAEAPASSSSGISSEGSSKSCSEGVLQNPWLRWVRDSMQERSIDAVHFVGHGFVADERPALMLAGSLRPESGQHAPCYLGVSELVAFLTQVGAWSAVFSNPPGSDFEGGLRLLADTLAQTRPGPVLFNRLAADFAQVELLSLYTFLYAPVPTLVPWSQRSWFAYCQPTLVDAQASVAPPLRTRAAEALDTNSVLFEGLSHKGIPRVLPFEREIGWLESSVNDSLRGPLEGPIESPLLDLLKGVSRPPLAYLQDEADEAPRWVSSAQRYVEQQSMQLQRDTTAFGPTGEAVAKMTDSASDEVSDEIERTLAKLQSIVGGIAQGNSS